MKKLATCLRCQGSGEEPGAPQRPDEFALCLDCGGKKRLPRNEVIVQMARDKYEEDGLVEFDDEPKLSEEDDNGTYVQAWVWVDFNGTALCKGEDGDHSACDAGCPVFDRIVEEWRPRKRSRKK